LRKLTTILILLSIFGCKNQPNNKSLSLTEIENQPTESIFDLIINKKETAENLETEFNYDSISNLSEQDKLKFKKVGLNNGYYLTNYNFLKKPIDTLDFEIYYKMSFGDQLEKIVKTKDSTFELILSKKGSDGQQSWYMNTEFLNDSVFIQTNVFKETAKDGNHSMAYNIDSTVTFYKFKNLHYTEFKKDTFNIYKEYPIFHQELKDSVFKTQSNIFKINNIRCQWEYDVRYTDETNQNSKELFVDLIKQKLLKFNPKESILELDLSKFAYIPPKNIISLEYNNYPQTSTDKLEDVNSDGYDDIQFVTEIAGGGTNTDYATYLFNPNNKHFEYSEIFSGYNVNYNSEKNRISTFGKSSVEDYYYTYINLEKNKKDVLFIEKVRHYGDTIFYEKIINKNVVKQKRILISETEGWESYLERK
jgi:hypothetical protein